MVGVGIGQRKVRNQMQVVINVPDKIYEMVMNTGTYGCYRFNSTKAIREGVSLPKGHGRLIDADYVTKDLNTLTDSFVINIPNTMSGGISIACCAPTIIEADEEGEDIE